ncbi:50S ribosomal protein L3 [archaeon]|nr:50S ribosomal protein L3 [archaeon]
MGAKSRPRSGSLAFHPRKRARRIFTSVRAVPDGKGALAFWGYKAGMTTIVALDNYQNSPSYGLQVALPATVIECPPLSIFGARAYGGSPLRCVAQVFAEKLEKELSRVFSVPKKYDFAKHVQSFEAAVAGAKEVRLLAHTKPREILLKKKPECLEMPVGGADAREKWAYAKELIGKTLPVSGLFREGEYADVTAVTSGKGTQGPVKRFGIKIQIRKNKGHRRFPGAVGAWSPSRVLWTVPQMGQLGFQRRTELNKRILKVGLGEADAALVNPKGGFIKYGMVSSDFLVLAGSVPGPAKRLVMLRHNIRPVKDSPIPSLLSMRTDKV